MCVCVCACVCVSWCDSLFLSVILFVYVVMCVCVDGEYISLCSKKIFQKSKLFLYNQVLAHKDLHLLDQIGRAHV